MSRGHCRRAGISCRGMRHGTYPLAYGYANVGQVVAAGSDVTNVYRG